MLWLSDGRARPSRTLLASLLAVVLLNSPAPVVLGLRTTPGSPCTDVCGTTTNTTSSEITCLDENYNSTSVGKDFQKCISCQLDSEFHDAETGDSDVNWALYNLRYAFSTCVFGYPDSISNVSSPCPVACDGVRLAVENDIDEPDVSNLAAWCETPSFADNVVDTCEFCYNMTTQQVYIANFLESIRYNCHFKTPTGNTFKIAPSRIFTQSLLPSSLSLTTPGASHSNLNLGVVIAVPIVGFLILICSITICCIFFIRHRRKKNRRTRRSSAYNRWNDLNGAQQQPWTDSPIHGAAGHGYGSGFVFVDNDGRGQELPYGHGHSQQQYAQQYQAQDKSGFTHDIVEQPRQYPVPVHEQVVDPDQKNPSQWQ
ncbi:uncharacterized protein N7515_001622 [Penicillium bovifimosum]|uniref:Uncharacterized protein n=1 Tax=Penicillium bovifimosum TaxID=126998 RepID=A0A9W9HA41_9EURO|nr:uncharacterized protein N7515_001622 [Penicillium bovifimosum]KAJ5142835.1 hypothetical protein N7515_001622 [Penicillium bovifimosum]